MKFSNKDLAEMKDFYLEEYEKTAYRLEHIRNILSRIDPDFKGEVPVNVSSIATTKVKKTRTTRKKKPGPKAIWGNYILKRLRQLDKPVTYTEIIKDAMLYFKLGDEKEKAVRQAIMNSAFRLRNKQGKIDTYRKPGSKEKYVGLKKWFNKEGSLLPEYRKRIS